MAGAAPVQTQEDILPPPPVAIGYRLSGVILAPSVAIAGYLILTGPVGLELNTPDGALDIREVLVVSVAVSLLAWLSATLLDRALGRPRGLVAWTWVALGLLVASLVAVLVMDIDGPSRWGLAVLHLLTGAVLIPTQSSDSVMPTNWPPPPPAGDHHGHDDHGHGHDDHGHEAPDLGHAHDVDSAAHAHEVTHDEEQSH